MGRRGRRRARENFSFEVEVEALYRVIGEGLGLP